MQVGKRAQAVDRVQGEDLEKAEDQVWAEDQGQVGELEQEEDQNPHSVLFLAHNQDQPRDLEQLRRLFPQQWVEEERLVLQAPHREPHREPLHLRELHK